MCIIHNPSLIQLYLAWYIEQTLMHNSNIIISHWVRLLRNDLAVQLFMKNSICIEY